MISVSNNPLLIKGVSRVKKILDSGKKVITYDFLTFLQMNGRTNILIGYSSRLFCDGLESIIGSLDRYTVIDSVPVWKGLFDRLANNNVEIVIIELCKPKKPDVDSLVKILHEYPGHKIFLISHLAHFKISRQLLDSGVAAYLLKSCSRKDLLMALDKLADNLNYYCTNISMSVMNSMREPQVSEDFSLTEREKEVLSDLVNCRTNIEIADKLGLSENTVKAHRRNIQAKFGVNNLLGMVRFACRSNLIDFGKDDFCLECPHCYNN